MPILSKEYSRALSSAALNIIISLFLSIYTARLLDVEDRGIFQYLATITLIANTVLTAGIPFSNSYFESKNLKIINDKLSITISTILSSTIVTIITHESTLEWHATLIYAVSSSIYFYLTERLKSSQRLKSYTVLISIQPFLCLAALSIAANKASELEFFLLIYSFSYLASILTIKPLHSQKKIPDQTDSKITRPQITYTTGYWATALSSVIVNNIDKLYIASILSMHDLGVYAVLQGAASLITRVSEMVAVTFFALSASGQQTFNTKKALTYITITTPFTYITGYLTGDYLVPLAFSERYSGFASECAIIFLSFFIGGMAWIFAQQAYADGKPLINMTRNLMSFLVFSGMIYIHPSTPSIKFVATAHLTASCFRLAYTLSLSKPRNNKP